MFSSKSAAGVTKLFREVLDAVGLIKKSFSLYSIRTGALSEAANSEDVNKDGLHIHGRWKYSKIGGFLPLIAFGEKIIYCQSPCN